MAANPLTKVQKRLQQFRSNRKLENDLKETIIPNMQKELLAAMKEADPDNVGIVFVDEEGDEVAAFQQQNSPTEFWNQERVVEFLRKKGNEELWRACSSRVFDPKKWEAEVANGNIPSATAEQFKEKGTTPKPFIRFGKPGKDSLK